MRRYSVEHHQYIINLVHFEKSLPFLRQHQIIALLNVDFLGGIAIVTTLAKNYRSSKVSDIRN